MGFSCHGHDSSQIGEKDMAIDLLLLDTPKNTYLVNGHNKQGERGFTPLFAG